MRRSAGIVVGFLVALMGGAALAASQQDYDACSQTADAGRSITACARIVSGAGESQADVAAAYLSLGNARAAGGDLSHAIAMYSLAIQANPQSMYAFAARAIASDRIGERERALADYKKACAADAAGLIEMTAGNDDLKAIAAAGAQCELSREYGAIATGRDEGSDFDGSGGGKLYVGMKFGAKSQDEADAEAKSRCLAQCRELSSTCTADCTEVYQFAPGECGYITIGTSPGPLVHSAPFVDRDREKVAQCSRDLLRDISDLTMIYTCGQEPVGACNK